MARFGRSYVRPIARPNSGYRDLPLLWDEWSNSISFLVTDVVPVWTTPSSGTTVVPMPSFRFTVPVTSVPTHYYIQLDKVNTFNSANLREYRSNRSQSNWEYWNGSSWVSIPSTGIPIVYAGNEARFTVPAQLSDGIWYRRIATWA